VSQVAQQASKLCGCLVEYPVCPVCFRKRTTHTFCRATLAAFLGCVQDKLKQWSKQQHACMQACMHLCIAVIHASLCCHNYCTVYCLGITASVWSSVCHVRVLICWHGWAWVAVASCGSSWGWFSRSILGFLKQWSKCIVRIQQAGVDNVVLDFVVEGCVHPCYGGALNVGANALGPVVCCKCPRPVPYVVPWNGM
jgi:hypothetical protein